MVIKKVVCIFSIICCFLFLIIPEKSKAYDIVQGTNCNSGNTQSYLVSNLSPIQQFFHFSTINYLTKVGVYLKGTGTVKFEMFNDVGTVNIFSTTLTNPGTPGRWMFYDLPEPTFVGDIPYYYKLKLSADMGQQVEWFYTDDSCVPEGAFVSYPPIETNNDFGFTTYGYLGAEPTHAPTPRASSSVVLPGAKPSSTVDSSIVVANDLKAQNDPADGKARVKLTWQRENFDDIDGFKIFAKKEGEDFTLIGSVENNIREYIDADVKNGETYIYMIRAYKGNSESANSNEAKILAELTEIKVENVTPADNYWQDPYFLALIITFPLALIGLIIWYLIYHKKRKTNYK